MRPKATKRPRMPLASEEMKQWSAMLGSEMGGWPKVQTRAMFGLRGFYRGKNIFAALPGTRGIRNPNALIFRIQPMPPDLLKRAKEEPRIDTENRIPSAKWFIFELHSEADLRDALWWLNQAYEHAK